jgi:hypothetical protein
VGCPSRGKIDNDMPKSGKINLVAVALSLWVSNPDKCKLLLRITLGPTSAPNQPENVVTTRFFAQHLAVKTCG